MKKCLVIRFSSFGDMAQLMDAAHTLGQGGFEVHWATKREFAELAGLCPFVHRVWPFDARGGLWGLIRFAFTLRKEHFSHLYDAHSNTRSLICCLILRFPYILAPQCVRRPKERWKRFLLFKLGINTFPRPYRGMLSYSRPLEKWGIKRREKSQGLSLSFGKALSESRKRELGRWADRVLLAPSAAWELKRWPLGHWRELVAKWEDGKFLLLGGGEDLFCEDLRRVAPNRVVNLAGRISLVESCYLVSRAKLLIAADTGLIHMADLQGIRGLALMGPTAFGFPTNPTIKALGVPLVCRPCSKDGRGKCSQRVYRQCMVDISVKWVLVEGKNQLGQ